jgi:hypothetical protein
VTYREPTRPTYVPPAPPRLLTIELRPGVVDVTATPALVARLDRALDLADRCAAALERLAAAFESPAPVYPPQKGT